MIDALSLFLLGYSNVFDYIFLELFVIYPLFRIAVLFYDEMRHHLIVK